MNAQTQPTPGVWPDETAQQAIGRMLTRRRNAVAARMLRSRRPTIGELLAAMAKKPTGGQTELTSR